MSLNEKPEKDPVVQGDFAQVPGPGGKTGLFIHPGKGDRCLS